MHVILGFYCDRVDRQIKKTMYNAKNGKPYEVTETDYEWKIRGTDYIVKPSDLITDEIVLGTFESYKSNSGIDNKAIIGRDIGERDDFNWHNGYCGDTHVDWSNITKWLAEQQRWFDKRCGKGKVPVGMILLSDDDTLDEIEFEEEDDDEEDD